MGIVDRFLVFARRELHLQKAMAEVGQREIPGPARSNPRIDEFLLTGIRNGKPLGLKGDSEFAWCAAFASWCGLPEGMTPRVAVSELCSDAKELGFLRLPSSGYEPRRGDLAIYARAGGNPLEGGQGHVNRLIDVGPVQIYTVGGNEADRVQKTVRSRSDVIAWISYDRA